jgi:glycosyltransferase involved in cell wall biosynthesis
LPVFNGESYVRKAIEAHLAQSYGDFELIISDNASTDSTAAICDEYARIDSRVRVVRQHVNCGVNLNHMKVFAIAQGEFFRWAAVDDIPSADLLDHAITLLDQDPALVVYVPDTANIDESGTLTRRLERTLDLRSASAIERVAGVLSNEYQMVFGQGLMRRSTLLSTSCRWNYFGWDFILLHELALRGQFCNVEGPLLYRRLHAGSAARATRKIAEVRRWVDPTVRSRILLPHWKWTWERVRAVLSCTLPIRDRLKLLSLVGRHARWDRAALKRDVVMAVKSLLRRTDEYPF